MKWRFSLRIYEKKNVTLGSHSGIGHPNKKCEEPKEGHLHPSVEKQQSSWLSPATHTTGFIDLQIDTSKSERGGEDGEVIRRRHVWQRRLDS